MLRAALIGGCLACLAWTGALASDIRSVAVMPPEAGGYYQFKLVSYRDLPFRTVVRQQFDFSCGSASLATLLRYHYGRDVDEAAVFKAMYLIGNKNLITRHGFSLADIKNYLTSVGYNSDGYRLAFDRYAKARIPAIAVIRIGQYKHFVVIKGVEDGQVLIGDPATGLHTYSIPEFEKVWDGVVFIIHDEAHPDNHHHFNDPAEWAMLHETPLELPDSHPHGNIFDEAAVLDYSTIFAERVPSPANTGP
jgi:uncharacterized protein